MKTHELQYKKKINQWDVIKLKDFCSTNRKTKSRPDWGKNICKIHSLREHVCLEYTENFDSSIIRQNATGKKRGGGAEQTLHQRGERTRNKQGSAPPVSSRETCPRGKLPDVHAGGCGAGASAWHPLGTEADGLLTQPPWA